MLDHGMKLGPAPGPHWVFHWVDGYLYLYPLLATLKKDGIEYRVDQTEQMKELDRYMVGVKKENVDRMLAIKASIA